MADNVLRSLKLQLPPSGRLWRTAKDKAEEWDALSAGETKFGEDDDEGVESKGAALVEAVEEVAKLAAAVDDWEILSDKSSSGGTTIIISKTGSVRSIGSLGTGSNAMSNKNSSTIDKLSPFTLQRSPSNSTIASEDNCSFGASCHDIVYGIPNVDYVEHVVMPTDTLQGICLSYKISATRLRQANQFSGSTLLLAPKKLVIPLSKNGVKTGAIRMQDRTTKAFKLQALLAEFQDMTADDAKKYLNTLHWDLDSAIRAAHSDGEWEKSDNAQVEDESTCGKTRKAGDIHITLKVHKGVPISARIRGSGGNGVTVESTVASSTVTHTDCSADDLHKAEPVHEGHGVELQTILSSKSSESG